MILYHWTAEKNLLGIRVSGLLPHVCDGRGGVVSAGQEVVWLTASETRTAAKADIEWLRVNLPKEVARFSKHIFGDPGDVRLKVKFNASNGRRLKRYWPWVQQYGFYHPETGERISLDILPFPPAARESFFVHLGRIPPSQIEFPPITARIALLGLKRGSPQRKLLRGVPPDTLVNLDVQ